MKRDWPAPGYYTALVRKHNWPPAFEPSTDWGKNIVAASRVAMTARAARVAAGDCGTIVGLSKRSDRLLGRNR